MLITTSLSFTLLLLSCFSFSPVHTLRSASSMCPHCAGNVAPLLPPCLCASCHCKRQLGEWGDGREPR